MSSETWGDMVADVARHVRALDEHVASVPDADKPASTEGLAHVTVRGDSLAFRAAGILVNGRALLCEDWKLGSNADGLLVSTVRVPVTLDIRSHASEPTAAPQGEQNLHHLSIVHKDDAFIACTTLMDGHRFPVATLDIEMRAGMPPIAVITFDCTVSVEVWQGKP